MRKSPVSVIDLSSAPDRAKEAVREMICKGEIACGERMDQRALARKLNLTTAPLREALSSLESEGLVQRVPGVGIFCKAYTVDEVEQIIEIRGVLEGLAGRRAAGALPHKTAEQLYEVARKLSDPNSRKAPDAFMQNHIRFHEMIAEASGSHQLQMLLKNNHIIDEVLSNIVRRYWWPPEPHDHTVIVDAIVSGDPDKAEQIIRDHIAPSYAKRIAALREKFGDKPIL